jgi:hypothetical protein
MIATFNVANARTSSLFREARLAMLTYSAIHRIDIADAAAAKLEEAVAEFAKAIRQSVPDEMIASRAAFLRLQAGQTLGM